MPETYNITNVFSESFAVNTYQVDRSFRFKPSFQLKLQQEIGERQLAEANLGYNVLADKGFAFVLVRSTTKVIKTPKINDELTLTTWHRESKGAIFYRCYEYHNKDDELAISSVGAFAIVDINTHKLLRPTVFTDICDSHNPGKKTVCADPDKLRLPVHEMDVIDLRPVRFSDIDCNGHVSNTVYADFMVDYLPADMQNKEIGFYQISYDKEALQGDNLRISRSLSGNTVYLAGHHDRGCCFEIKCTLK